MFKVECAKCAGKGEIRAYIGIAGGICFACNGKGHIIQKTAPTKTAKFAVSAVHRETGEVVNNICHIRAKNESEAIKKATAQIARGTGYVPNTITVKQW